MFSDHSDIIVIRNAGGCSVLSEENGLKFIIIENFLC